MQNDCSDAASWWCMHAEVQLHVDFSIERSQLAHDTIVNSTHQIEEKACRSKERAVVRKIFCCQDFSGPAFRERIGGTRLRVPKKELESTRSMVPFLSARIFVLHAGT